MFMCEGEMDEGGNKKGDSRGMCKWFYNKKYTDSYIYRFVYWRGKMSKSNHNIRNGGLNMAKAIRRIVESYAIRMV